MKHYIEVTRTPEAGGCPRRVLLNVTRIVNVAETPSGCRVYLTGYSFPVTEDYETVRERLRAAELERM